jgi:hypothetical protein
MSTYRIQTGHAVSFTDFVASTTNIVANWAHATNGYPWRIATTGIVNHGSRVKAVSAKAYRRGGMSLRWDMGSPITRRQIAYWRETIFTDTDTAISNLVTIMTDQTNDLASSGDNRIWPVIRCVAEEAPEEEWRVYPNGMVGGYYILFSRGVYLPDPS